LDDPGSGRVLLHVEVKNSPPIMRDNKEAVEHAKGERRRGKEIHGCNRFVMVVQKGRPTLCRLRSPWGFPHPAQHSSLGNIEAEHLQFTMNARRAPILVLRNRPEDEFTQFPAHAFSSRSGPVMRKPCPIHLEASPMPANDSL